MSKIVIIPGEPAGIGPDIILQLLQQQRLGTDVVIFADKALLAARAQLLGIDVSLDHCVQHIPLKASVTPGQLDTRNVPYVLETLKEATTACLKGKYHALVTGPVHKGIINDAGIPFSGQTEYLATLTHAPHPVMLLATPTLKVALATTHLPLSKVPQAITYDSLCHTIHVLHDDLVKRFNIPHPHIRVCGLNPHAGENGHLGHEEQSIITPAIVECQKAGIRVSGPFSADTIFVHHDSMENKIILAMYHDQGLPVIKSQSFGEAVNVTLGLPMIRTSVDHGTALELAGTGKASADSLLAALNLARILKGY